MNNRSTQILLIGGGVVLLYVAYTGYLTSAWNGITGNCDCGTKPTTGGTSGSGTVANTGPGGAAGRKATQRAGDVPRPSRQYLSRGSYNVSPTGGLRVTDAGQW